mmetsp:Transcript_116423/g.324436  ORF Transcript_116423/g.324436 Transcript_116423/m.324436 type:complete len:214 (-) Transcript_116423:607-1248(-)
MEDSNDIERHRRGEGNGLPPRGTDEHSTTVSDDTRAEANEDREVPQAQVLQRRWAGSVADRQRGAQGRQAEDHRAEARGHHGPSQVGTPPHQADHRQRLQSLHRHKLINQGAITCQLLSVDALLEVTVGIDEVGSGLHGHDGQHQSKRGRVPWELDAQEAPEDRQCHQVRRERGSEAPRAQGRDKALEEAGPTRRRLPLVHGHLLQHGQRTDN